MVANRVCLMLTVLSLLLSVWPARALPRQTRGVLLLAHGGSAGWNANVMAIAAEVGRAYPVEVAFGMADRGAIRAALEKLEALGVREVVAVPLFVSSHSSVYTSTEYLLGLRDEMPDALRAFARMSHGGGGHGGHATHEPAADALLPIPTAARVRMSPALDAHDLVADIVTTRALDLSVDAEREAVVLVAHGPVTDEDNAHWVENLRRIGARVSATGPFRAVESLTVRDDAPAPVRDAATRELRAVVERHARDGRVLVVPVLLSYGGIEAGIRERLEGLEYVMARQALAPDPRLVDWVLAQVR